MDWLTLQWLGDVGSTTLVVIFVLAILTGKLRPQSAVKEVRDDRDARLAEYKAHTDEALKLVNIYRDAYTTTEAARRDQAKVLNDLVNVVKTLGGTIPPSREGDGHDSQEA